MLKNGNKSLLKRTHTHTDTEREYYKKGIAASREFWISALANGSRELKNKQQIKHYTRQKWRKVKWREK